MATLVEVKNIDALPHYLSLGAGVQSSTLAMMYACRELSPMPKAAIFADTQDEPESVYRWLDWLEEQLPFPVHRVTAGKLSESALIPRVTKDGRIYTRTNVPVFTLNSDGSKGKVMMRSCTRDYKIRPLNKKLRKLAGIKRGEKTPQCVSVIGISLDEINRVKQSSDPWVVCRWPLVENRIRRLDCEKWFDDRGHPKPPRSACWHCPFHHDREWGRMKTEEPNEFEKAVTFENRLQEMKKTSQNFTSIPFLHSSCVPLDEVDFRSDVERGQLTLWDEECSGMCGV